MTLTVEDRQGINVGAGVASYSKKRLPAPAVGRTAALAILAGAHSYSADAQSTASPSAPSKSGSPVTASPDNPEAIVITATKRRENIQSVPLAVTARSGDELVRTGINETAELVQVVPGLTYAKSGTNTPIYSLRGIGFNTRNLSATSPVGIYVNESSYAYPYMGGGPLFDIQRVEVLKGPQGTLFGRNTTGGLINFITRRPENFPEGYVQIGFGNYNSLELEAAGSLPLSEGLKMRVALRGEKRFKGWQESVSRPGDRLGKKSLSGARFSLDWKGPGIASELTIDYWRNRSDTQAVQPIALRADYPFLLPPDIQAAILDRPDSKDADWDEETGEKPDFNARDSFVGISERLTIPLGDFDTLVSLSGFNHLKRDDFNDLDGTRYEFNAFRSIGEITSFSQELRVTGDRDRLKYIGGLYYAHDKLEDTEIGYVNDATTILALRFLASLIPQSLYTSEQIATGFRNFFDQSTQKNRTISVFGNAQYRLTERIELAAGARYGRDRLTYAGCSYDFEGNTAPIWNTAIAFLTGATDFVGTNECLTYKPGYTSRNTPLFKSQLKQENLSFRTSLKYDLRPVLLYGSVARGFKNGAYPLIPANLDTQLTPARQERLTAYEVGAKATLLAGKLKLRSDIFYYDYRNKQTYGAIPDPVFITLNRIINIPKSRVYGAEVEADWHVLPELSLNAAATVLNSRIQKYDGFDLLGQPVDFSGKQFTFTPKFQGSASATWTKPLSSKLGLSITTLLSYQSRSWGDLQNSGPYRVKGYALVNADIAVYRLDDSWRASVWANNLLNGYYWTYAGYERETIYRVAGMPRTFGVRLSKAFH